MNLQPLMPEMKMILFKFQYHCLFGMSRNKILILLTVSVVPLLTHCSGVLSGENSCFYAFDGECDDGGPGSQYSVCAYGTDRFDCGSRIGSRDCSIPDGSSLECDCNIDSDCPSGYFCDEGTGFDACVRSGSGNGGEGTISDGLLLGLNGRNIRATINVEPNSGPLGTPVQLTISFSVGGGDVEAIETWQNTETFGGFVRTEFDPTGFRLDPTQQSSTRWTNNSLFLTGVSAVVRYIAVNRSGERIALGEIDVNGGL